MDMESDSSNEGIKSSGDGNQEVKDPLEKDILDEILNESQIRSGKTLGEDELKELNEIERSRESEGEYRDIPDDVPFQELVYNFEQSLEEHNREITEIQNRPSFRDRTTSDDVSVNNVSTIEKKVEIFDEEDKETKTIIEKLEKHEDSGESEDFEVEIDESDEDDPPSPIDVTKDISDPNLIPITPEHEHKVHKSGSIRLQSETRLYEEFQNVRQLLLENGYRDIELEGTRLGEDQLMVMFDNVKQLFVDFRKRGRVLYKNEDNRTSEVEHLLRKNQSLETEMERMKENHRFKVRKHNKKIIGITSNMKNERKKNLLEKKKLSNEVLRLRKTNQTLREKHQKSSHSLKLEESKTKRLKADLATSRKMNSSSLRRAEQLFTQYYKKKPRTSDPKDKKEVQLVRFLHHKLENTQKHVRFLEKKVNELSLASGKKGRLFVQSVSPGQFNNKKKKKSRGRVITTRPSQIGRTPSPPSTPLQPNGEEHHQEEVGTENQSRMTSDSLELRRMSETVSSLRMELEGMKKGRMGDINDLEHQLRRSMERARGVELENQDMVQELQTRPTYEMYEQLKSQNEELIRRLRSSRKTSQLDFTNLDVSREELSKEKKYLKEQTAKRMVLRVMEVLELERGGDIIPTLKKTRVLVQAIPKLRNFVYKVLKIVREGQKFLSTSSFVDQRSYVDKKRRRRRLEEGGGFEFVNIPSKDVNSKVVPGILENWMSLLMELQSYKDLEMKSIHLLSSVKKGSRRRKKKNTNKNSFFDDGDGIFQFVSTDLSHGMKKRKILNAVHHLVEMANKGRKIDETFRFLEESASKSGGSSGYRNVHKNLMEHFMKLFEVREMNGVIPKMNQLYRSTNELRNMLNVLREIFELPRNCGLKEIVQQAKKVNGDFMDGIVQM